MYTHTHTHKHTRNVGYRRMKIGQRVAHVENYCACAPAHSQTSTHARTRARAHTHTHTQVLIGSGFQLFVMTILTLCFAMLGFLSPANRGALLSSVLVLCAHISRPPGCLLSPRLMCI